MNIAESIRAETERLSAQLSAQPPASVEQTLALLDAVTALHQAVAAARTVIAANAGALVRHALELGVEPKMLINRPYNGRTVADIYRQTGLPPRRPGPRPVKPRRG
jgi:hypothetical protein